MNNNDSQSKANEDVLEQFVANIQGLQEKVARTSSHHQDIIHSLQRIQRALCSIEQLHRR